MSLKGAINVLFALANFAPICPTWTISHLKQITEVLHELNGNVPHVASLTSQRSHMYHIGAAIIKGRRVRSWTIRLGSMVLGAGLTLSGEIGEAPPATPGLLKTRTHINGQFWEKIYPFYSFSHYFPKLDIKQDLFLLQ